MELKDCLKYAVGLSENECNCFEDGKPTDEGEEFNRSDSGYFIDDMEHGIPLVITNAASDCDDGGIWSILEDARENGIKEFQTSLAILLSQYNKRKFNSYTGGIGDDKHSKVLTVNGQYVAMYLQPKKIRGGKMVIKGGTVTSHATGTTNVAIRTSDDNFTADVEMKTVAFQAKKRTSFEFDNAIEVDIFDSSGNLQHVAMYADLTTFQPRNTQFNCGCSGARRGWQPYVDGYGIYFDDPAAIEAHYLEENLLSTQRNQTFGLSMNVSMVCKEMDWMCENQDYIYDPWARVAAKCIQLFSINKAIGYVLNSQKVNAYTLLRREALYGKRNHNRKLIEAKMAWLASNIPTNATDCFLCGDQRMHKRAIIV